MRILIVCQNPSKNNLGLRVPFIPVMIRSTNNNLTLIKWLKTLGVSRWGVINCSNLLDTRWTKSDIKICSAQIRYIYDNNGEYHKVLALGNIASKVLTLASIQHFKLPHPSGRNRKLNDRLWLDGELRKCREYLHD